MKTNTNKILRSTIFNPAILRFVGFVLIISSLIVLGRLLTGNMGTSGADRAASIEQLRLEQVAFERELLEVQAVYAELDKERLAIQATLDEKLLELDAVRTQGSELRSSIEKNEVEIKALRDGEVREEVFQ